MTADFRQLDAAIADLPLADQPYVYRGHATILRQFTRAVRRRKAAGQRPGNEE